MKLIKSLFLFPLLFSMACFSNSEDEKLPNNTITRTPQATSLNGKPLYPMPVSAKTKAKQDSLLAIAKANYDNDPNSLESIIWYGRRTAYKSLYNEAISIYTDGIKLHPGSPELYRHRGHRYLSQRKLDEAIADFEKAAALSKDQKDRIEQDGLPNKLNIPLSTLKFNIFYHLGLAHYLKGDFTNAEKAYLDCMKYSQNADLLSATSDWLYMTYRRQGKVAKAETVLERITPGMNIIENDAYYNRLLMYKGMKQADELLDFDNITEDNLLSLVTQGYGVGNWYLYNKQAEKAKAIFKKITSTDYWSAFGFIAAEAELVRM